jgi:glutamate-5-semialdehyde dehydrogenase
VSVHEVAERAKAASRVLAAVDGERRNAALEAIAAGIEGASEALLAANAEDVARAGAIAEGSGAAGEAGFSTTLTTPPGGERPSGTPARSGRDDNSVVSAATLARLRLDEGKLREMAEQVRSVAALADPLGRTLDAVELDDADPAAATEKQIPFGNDKQEEREQQQVQKQILRFAKDDKQEQQEQRQGQQELQEQQRGLHLRKVSVPLGVLGVIFEARPDAVTQIAALALKSGNAVILKAGREVERTAAVLVQVIREAVQAAGLPADAVALITGREQAAELLGMHGLVDLMIPRGSNSLVEYVQANTRIPVLGHAEGVCHIYVDRSADEALALRVIEDAKTDYPAACNAVETVLVHREIAEDFLPKLMERMRARGVSVHMGEEVADWHCEYGELEMSVGVVESLEAAIAHIHAHGSSHTESILTEDEAAAERFLREVDAAGVFHNASTRFADGFRYGFGAEVGISTSKLHARGPVGLEGLTTYKYVLRGAGHVAGDYRGAGARVFTHRRETGA